MSGGQTQGYRIYLPAVPAKHKDDFSVPSGYYGHVPGVSMNRAIYCRVGREEAEVLSREQALRLLRTELRGWPARCEPPLVVEY